MSEPQSIDEVMKRIRAQLGTNAAAKPASAERATAEESSEKILERIKQRLQRPAPAGAPATEAGSRTASPAQLPFKLTLHDLRQLGKEIDTAREGSRLTGQLNPRNPGPINGLIQFAKRVMKRSLTWYTRPLHLFQGGVIRALDQLRAIVDNHNDSLRKVADELVSQATTLEQKAAGFDDKLSESVLTLEAKLKEATSRLEQKAAGFDDKLSESVLALEAKLKEVTSRLEQKAAGLNDKLSESVLALEAKLKEVTSRLEQKAAGLDDKLSESVLALEAKLKEATSRYEVRFAEAATAHQAGLSSALAPYSTRIASITDELETLRSELRQTRAELREANTRGRVRDRDVRRTLYALQNGEAAGKEQAHPPTPAMFRSEIKSDREFDYFAFEELYRGDEADIRQRQQEYLQYFRGRDNVVDLGCGRGEFLEVLRDNDISARGVELGLDQYLLCREKGLDVVQQDLFSFLESLPDESLGGLFSAQVIEHLTASDQLRYVVLAHQKTKPGSPVIFETINAQCVYAVMRNFFLDPTHVRPVHPETLKFAMESMQFKDVKLLFSSPVPDKQIPPLQLEGGGLELERFNRAIDGLNNLVYGYQDYAAIGWK
jgi:O-antigen chain-terminating methyltransferase